jgi:glucose/arabinose dehydrogenase
MLSAPEGGIYLANAGAGRILQIESPSLTSPQWGEVGSQSDPGEGAASEASLSGASANGDSPSPGAARRPLPIGARSFCVLADGLDSPEGLAFLDEKTLLVAEVGRQRLTAIDLQTGARRTIAENLPIGQGGPPGWPKAFVPTGLAVGKSGVVYVASDLDCAIYRLTPR